LYFEKYNKPVEEKYPLEGFLHIWRVKL